MRARSVGLLAVAAAPLAAYASVEVPPVQLPSFNCYGAAAGDGGTIDWASGFSLQPNIAFTESESSTPSYSPLSCSQEAFSEKVDVGEIVIIKTTDKSSTNLFQLDTRDGHNPFDFKFGTEVKGEDKYSLWDISLNVLKYNADGVLIDELKEFIGIQIQQKEYVSDAMLKFSDGSFLFDPTIEAGGSISLYTTPQVTPEPGTLVLLGTGLLGIGTAMRRRLGW